MASGVARAGGGPAVRADRHSHRRAHRYRGIPRFLYWINIGASAHFTDGSVNDDNLDGSNPHTIVTSQNNPGAVALSPPWAPAWWSSTARWQRDLGDTHKDRLGSISIRGSVWFA